MNMRMDLPAPILPLLVVFVSTFMAVVFLSRQDPARALAGVSSDAVNSPPSATVTAFPFQLGTGIEGIALIDPENQTICIYQYELRKAAHERFSLVAARSFSNDCLLTDYNNAEPNPETVKKWVLRARQSADPNRPGVKIIKK